jgi:hypothetical protein
MNSLSKWLKSTSLNLKNSSFSLWVTGISVIGLVDCQAPSNTHYSLRPLEDIKPEIPNYEEPVIKQATWQNLNESQEMRYQPKVDIVFLIDNSTSMRPVQENLARNIDQFVSSLNSLKALDYQIGVMTNWDDYTTTFQSAHPEGPGALRIIPGLERRFFTKSDERMTSRLAQALKVGVMDVKDGGPEHESFLTPLVGMLERAGRGAPNEGFLRKEAYLAVILITDADDMSQNLTPEQVARALAEFKGDPRQVMVYGVLTRAEDRDDQKDPGLRKTPRYHPECFVSVGNSWKDNGLCPKAFGPSRLESLLLHANAYLGNKQSIWSRRWFHIHSRDFGRNLTRVSEDIVVSSSHKEWILPSRPAVDKTKGEIQIRVNYRSVNQTLSVPFDYLPETNKVMVRSLPQSVRSLPAGEFMIEWLPVVDE